MIPPRQLSLKEPEDKELWTVEGKLDDGFQWRLPIVVYPHMTADEPVERWNFVFGSSYLLSARQHQDLSVILDHHDCIPDSEKGWWFRQDVLETFATKAPGITGEFYIRWPGYEVPKTESGFDVIEVPEEPGFNSDELKFLKHLQNVTGTQTWEAMKFFWLAFRKQAIMWVAKERRVLDLGFIRIVPTPYRINWKELLAVRFSGILSCFKGTAKEKRQQTLQESGFFEALGSVQILAIDREKDFCRWSFEALPSSELEQTICDQEHAKRQRLGLAGYARHTLRSMEGRLADTLRIFSTYVRLISIPPGQKKESDARLGTQIIVPDLRPGRVRPGKGICDVIDISPTPFSKLSDFDDGRDHEKPVKEQVKVPEFLRSVTAFKELPEKFESNGFS